MPKDVEISIEELKKQFYSASNPKEQLSIFSQIDSDDVKLELLRTIPEEARNKFINKLTSTQAIITALGEIEDEERRSKTFGFVAKRFKGNSKQLLQMLSRNRFQG